MNKLIRTLFILITCTFINADAKSSKSKSDLIHEFISREARFLPSIDSVISDDDLSQFDSLASQGTKVLALGESEHGVYEPAKLRNRLFQYLVENHDYKVLMLESGLLESRLVDQYIKGLKVDGFSASKSGLSQVEIEEEKLMYVLKNGVTHGMGHYEETKELVVWMKDYNNGKAMKDMLSFVGPDLTVIGDSPFLALNELSVFLKRNDQVFYQSKTYQETLRISEKISRVTMKVRELFKAKYGQDMEIDPDLLDGFGTVGFDQISKNEEMELEKGLKRIKQHLAKNWDHYLSQGVIRNDLHWFTLLPVFSEHMLRNLRNRRKYPKVYMIDEVHNYLKATGLYEGLVINDYQMDMTKAEDLKTNFKGRETREQSLAELIIETQKKKGKTMIFAHNLHLITGETKIKLGNLDLGVSEAKGEGEFLKQHYKEDYKVIVTSMGEYVEDVPVSSIQDCDNCIEKYLSVYSRKTEPMVIKIDRASRRESKALNQFWGHRNQFDFQSFNPKKSYHCLIYFEQMKHGNKIK